MSELDVAGQGEFFARECSDNISFQIKCARSRLESSSADLTRIRFCSGSVVEQHIVPSQFHDVEYSPLFATELIFPFQTHLNLRGEDASDFDVVGRVRGEGTRMQRHGLKCF